MIDLHELVGDMLATPDERKGSCCEDHADWVYRRISQDRSGPVAAIKPYLDGLSDPGPA